ncbi:BON domain-containing protein [Zhongshania aquimaris]|uniref:BON domain-containing protein n=1 Tax=Zhongshania aquimaris TaxID=2857107 RepID=A0ABS6VQB2_9GAMM|nr:BON domain-containing protein [Zhongshania aquimaris]MBW2940223.1 BON domain-containing protein [Zhongshania aquimaris]
MNIFIRFGLTIALTLFMSACTQIITATTDKPIADDPGSRSLGSYVDDEIIETKVLVNINKTDPALKASRISATSHNAIVLLTGNTASEDLRQLAGEVASGVKKVRKVHNELSVGADVSMLARSNDAWISTKVKSRLSLNEQLDASKIKVVTENGIVYLMGLVSKAESDTAATVVSETSGVQKVVRVFEYY